MPGMDRKKVLFIDRDGVIVKERQVDTYESIEYIPHVFEALREISKRTDFSLVMVSNQDGVGTRSFTYEGFSGPAERIFSTLRGEGIVFDDINIDLSFPEDGLPTRKPGTGMIDRYRELPYDMESSFMIGDRLTDMMLASSMGCRGFLLDSSLTVPDELKSTVALQTSSWLDIAAYLVDDGSLCHRTAEIRRRTNETDIILSIDLDGTGEGCFETGIGFFDHMLSQIVRHSRFDINGRCKGDTFVDEHHSAEDTALVLGEAVRKALGDKRGIERYGYEIVMMDDVVATVALDFSGRPELVFCVSFTRDYIGSVSTQMFSHFFKSFCDAAGCNIYASVSSGNAHHQAEALFKAFARAVRMAVKRVPGLDEVVSTKGVLE